jgi:hypothetical protein
MKKSFEPEPGWPGVEAYYFPNESKKRRSLGDSYLLRFPLENDLHRGNSGSPSRGKVQKPIQGPNLILSSQQADRVF